MPTTPESRIKIQVNNLTKRFGDLTVLDGINFNIKEGELLAIVGPTGCGKTTFLNTLSKLMPATEGEILIDGEEANPKKHNISYVFQEPTCLPWRTVRETWLTAWKSRASAKKNVKRARPKSWISSACPPAPTCTPTRFQPV